MKIPEWHDGELVADWEKRLTPEQRAEWEEWDAGKAERRKEAERRRALDREWRFRNFVEGPAATPSSVPPVQFHDEDLDEYLDRGASAALGALEAERAPTAAERGFEKLAEWYGMRIGLEVLGQALDQRAQQDEVRRLLAERGATSVPDAEDGPEGGATP